MHPAHDRRRAWAPTWAVAVILAGLVPAPALAFPEVALTKSPEFQLVNEGETATFTIAVRNTGDEELTNVTVEDAATPSCDRNLGSLLPGQNASYSCETGPLFQSFANLAVVFADQDVGDEASAFVEVVPQAVEITKTPDLQSIAPGQTATFTITITNLTEVSLTELVVVDPGTPDCARGGGGEPPEPTLPDLGAFESTFYTCETSPLFNDFTNVAAVTALLGNEVPVSDTDEALVDVLQPIEIRKEPAEQIVAPGESATFDISVTNLSQGDTLTNVVVSDPLTPDCDRNLGTLMPLQSTGYTCQTGPLFANLTNVATVTADGPEVPVTDSAGADVLVAETRIEIRKEPLLQMLPFAATASFTITVTNPDPTAKENVVVSDPLTPDCSRSLGTLAPGASADYTCSTGPLLADLENLATATADSVTGPVQAQATALVDIDEPLALTKEPFVQQVAPGGAAGFTLTVTNLSASTLTAVTVTDPLTPDCGRDLGSLAAGESASYACASGALANDFINVATVTATTAAGPVTATASAVVDVTNPLEIVKTALTPLVPAGDAATFQITLTNVTMETMSNLVVTDPLTPDCARSAGALADLPGETSISYTCETGALDADLTNTATVTADSPGGPVELSASATVEVIPPMTCYTAPTATGTGDATLCVDGGPGCELLDVSFIPLAGDPLSPPAGSSPAGVQFPHGLFHFVVGESCTAGGTLGFTLFLPQALPPGTSYWKHGPTAGDPVPHWYVLPSTVAGDVVTFSITDGGLGDDDLTADGTVIDQGGPGVPARSVLEIPTLGGRALALLAGLLALGGLLALRRSG